MDRPTMESTSKTARPFGSTRYAGNAACAESGPRHRRRRRSGSRLRLVVAGTRITRSGAGGRRGAGEVLGPRRPTGAAENDKTAKSEMWFSMKNAVAAGRHGDWAIYDDGRAGVRLEYDPSQKQIYRLSATPFTKKHIRAMQAIFSDLFRGSEKLGADFGGMRVVKQQRRQVSEKGGSGSSTRLSFDKSNGITGVGFASTRRRCCRSRWNMSRESAVGRAGVADEIRFRLSRRGPGRHLRLGRAARRRSSIAFRLPRLWPACSKACGAAAAGSLIPTTRSSSRRST